MFEDKLPDKIKEKARISLGGEYAWKMNDIEEVIDQAQKVGLACVGGQPQFQLPEGTYELYWINYESTEIKIDELWEDYVVRSANEVKREFNRRCIETDFLREADSFNLIKIKLEEKDFNLLNYLYFVLYFDCNNDTNKGPSDLSK